MISRLSRPIVCLSIRCQPSAIHGERAEQTRVDALAERLSVQLGERKIPATWAVADPMHSPLVERLKFSGGQELALLLEDHDAIDSPFANGELARRVKLAREAGLPLTTVAVESLPTDNRWESLARLGILGISGRRRSLTLRRATPRFGVWSFSDAVSLPGTSRWLPGGGGLRSVRDELELASTEPGLLQIGVHLGAVAARGRAAERVVARAIDLVDRRLSQGAVDVVTLATAAVRLARECSGRPSRSILRPAA